MSKFNVVIFKLPALYEILNEFKSDLNFNLYNVENNNSEFKKFMDENPQSLLISSEASNNFKNHILYKKKIKIKNLLELINISFSKSSYSLKSNINVGKYIIDTNSRNLTKNGLSLKLTEREVNILIYLNESTGEKNILELQKNVWNYSKDLETHTVETHIYRLRKKIFDKFEDSQFILNNKNGYSLKK